MSYTALYRKYRPDAFASVYGQRQAANALQGAVKRNSVHHSYIFAGPRGTGKTSVARIFAKAVNCLSPIDGDCCNKCANCKTLGNGDSMDLTEIDAASHNGVDEVRSLIETVSYPPTSVKKKVYIIDEAHMLTASAWNALLKTLEEPPSFIIFIIATTEPGKIPVTILSRSQRYDFLRIPDSDIVALLQFIAKKENIKADAAALRVIAALSHGGARDAIGVLDQLAMIGDRTVSSAQVSELFHLAGNERVRQLTEAILKRDSSTAIAVLDGLYEHGVALMGLCNELLASFVSIALGANDVPDDASIGGTVAPYPPEFVQEASVLARKTVSFLIALKSFEISRYHFRLLYLILTNEERLLDASNEEQAASRVVPVTAAGFVNAPPNLVAETLAKNAPLPAGPHDDNALPKGNSSGSSIEFFKVEAIDNVPGARSEADKDIVPIVSRPVRQERKRLSETDLVTAVMYLNDPEIKKAVSDRLAKVDDLLLEHKEAANYRDARILVACREGIVLAFKSAARAAMFNKDMKKYDHELFSRTLFGGVYQIVSVDNEQAKEITEKVKIMRQNNSPPPSVDELTHRTSDDEGDTLKFAKDMFGDLLKVA